MSGNKYIIGNSSNLFEDDEDIDDETFLKNFKQGNPQSNLNSYQAYEQRKNDIEQRTLSSTHRSLGLLHETEQVGIATAEELAKQREQLENTSKQLDDINATLRFSQKHLNGLKSVFGGLKNYLSGQKDMDPRRASLQSDNSKLSETGGASGSVAAAGNKSSYNLNSPVDKSYDNHPIARLRSDDNLKQHQQKTGSFNEQLDKNLDEMAGSLSRLKGLAIDLHDDIEQQNDLIDNITNKVDNVDVKIGRQNKDMNKLLGKK